MSESSSHQAPGTGPLVLEGVEWLASGAHSGMLRVHGRGAVPGRGGVRAPVLVLRSGAELHRYTSLRDARSDSGGWRAAYVLAGERLSRAGKSWLEWEDGIRVPLPAVETDAEYATGDAPLPAEPAGEVIDRAVLAERRAQRAEAAQRAQASATADALAGLAALERRLEQLTAERDALAEHARALEAGSPSGPSVRLVQETSIATAAESTAGLREALEAARAARASAERDAERRGRALASTREALAQLKLEVAELRLRLRTRSAAAGVDAVRLAVVESERGAWHGLLEAARAEARALRARLAREQHERGVDARSLRVVHARVAGLKGQRDELRIELDGERGARRRAEREASAHVAARDAAIARAEALDSRLQRANQGEPGEARRLRAQVEELAGALETARAERVVALAEADAARLAERAARTDMGASAVARAAAERERRARARAQEARLDSVQAELAEQKSARSALVAELERERQSRRRAAADARAQRAAAEASNRRIDALEAELAGLTTGSPPDAAPERAAQERIASLLAETGELRTRTAALQEKLDRTRRAVDAAHAEGSAESAHPPIASDLQGRIQALQSRSDGRDGEGLQVRAREQLRVAAAVRPAGEQAGQLASQLDAAAAALRTRVAQTASGEVPEAPVAGGGSRPAPIVVPARDVAPRFRAAAPATPATARRSATGVRSLGNLLRPASRLIAHPLGPARPAARLVAQPLLRREPRAESLTSLRGALVRLAHEDSFTAARVLASLLAAQGAFVADDIDYDLTIHELGCFAVTVVDGRTSVRAVRKPRPRRQAELHVSAAAVTLAELLAGRHRRVGRLLAPVRLRGPRERFEVIERIGAASASLGDVVRAGASLDPWLVMRVLPHAVDPAWTEGHSFTVAQEITGARPQTWYIAVEGRAGVSVSPIRPVRRPDARVSMPRGTFDRLLAGDAPDPGRKPWVWGDFAAVDRLRGWAERARA